MANKMPKKRTLGREKEKRNVCHEANTQKLSKDHSFESLKKKGLWFSYLTLVLLSSVVLYIYLRRSSVPNPVLKEKQPPKVPMSSTPETKKTPVEKLEIKKEKKHLSEKDDFTATIHNQLSPKSINFQGRQINFKEIPHENKKSSVHVYIAENFLSRKECEGLSQAHLRHVASTSEKTPIVCFSDVITMNKYLHEIGQKKKLGFSDFTHGTSCINTTFSEKIARMFKYSYSTAFYRSESQFAKLFEERVEALTQLAQTHGGKFQITSYQNGVGYKNHTDCNEDSDLRDRFATVLVYLKDVKEGGETKFPGLGISVKPRQGRLLVWNNMRPDGSCDPTSIHNAAKVKDGHKIIIQRWYYYKNFFSLGKRPPEPGIPKREEFQPRVSCDEFEQGSCRWYDEWGYDHITSYMLSKHKLV